MRVVSLGSGSSGNALLVEAGPNGRTKLLVDAGFTGRILRERLRTAGVALSQIQGVLITHEHADHILGLPTLMKRYAIPVVADPRTLAAIEQIFTTGMLRTESGALVSLETESSPGLDHLAVDRPTVDRPTVDPLTVDHLAFDHLDPVDDSNKFPHPAHPNYIHLTVGSHCIIGDIEVLSFPVSHDAVAPCGYLLSAGGCRVCVAIDSGVVTPIMLEAMNQADLLVLESNHDRERLLRGPYPYSLKQRILSPTGHLSNDQAAEAVLRTWRTDAVRWLWLSHLSRTNNTPKLALNSMRTRIQEARANLAQIHISALSHNLGGVWDSTQLWHVPSLWEMQM
ncbi:MAG TPA: MBL fold metallo-hydrolase [Ktedonobacteraceae bacterium]